MQAYWCAQNEQTRGHFIGDEDVEDIRTEVVYRTITTNATDAECVCAESLIIARMQGNRQGTVLPCRFPTTAGCVH